MCRDIQLKDCRIEQERGDLDFAARKIQALYRGKLARKNMQGIKRKKEPLQPSRIKQLMKQSMKNPQLRVGCLTSKEWKSQDPIILPFVFSNQIVICDGKYELSSNQASRIAEHLSKNKRVKTLLIPYGNISNEGLLELANCLRSNQGLQVLAIGRNNIGIDTPWCNAFTSLANILSGVNFHLKELILEDNAIEDSGGMHLARAVGDFFFARYGQLERLVLARCSIGDVACAAFGKALQINRKLKVLDLNGNKITSLGGSSIANGILDNRTIVEINLSDNLISSDGARTFIDVLDGNDMFQSLYLINNNIKNDIVHAVKQLLESNPTLCRFELGGNLVHKDHIDMLWALTLPRYDPKWKMKLAPKKQPRPENWFELEKEKLLRGNRRMALIVQPPPLMNPMSPVKFVQHIGRADLPRLQQQREGKIFEDIEKAAKIDF